MDIRPIRTGKDHTSALREIERLWGAEISTPDGDKLDVLATLVDAYENIRWPFEALDPVETIKAHMEVTGRDQSDLAKVLGSRSRASEVMARKRPLTLSMVRRLASNWHLPADTLISPYRLAGASASRKARKRGTPRPPANDASPREAPLRTRAGTHSVLRAEQGHPIKVPPPPFALEAQFKRGMAAAAHLGPAPAWSKTLA